jgi:hypothetical protein
VASRSDKISRAAWQDASIVARFRSSREWKQDVGEHAGWVLRPREDVSRGMSQSMRSPMPKREKPNAMEYIGRPGLKSRGWTNSMIDEFMPEPDEIKQNPHYKSAAPCNFYLLSRVLRRERSRKFIAAKEQAEKRQQAASKAIATKRKKLREYLDSIVIGLPRLARDELERRALAHWRAIRRDHWEPGESPTWIDTISVNYLRHELSRYHVILHSIAGRVGAEAASLELFDKVVDEIASVYPHLQEECSNQSMKRHHDQLSMFH